MVFVTLANFFTSDLADAFFLDSFGDFTTVFETLSSFAGVLGWGCPLVPLFVGLAGDGVTGLAIALLFTDFLTCTTDSLISLLTFGVIET
jgi:hypothetical protein